MGSPPGEPFDFVVVGAGSSGCVVANRLSADPSTRVLLLEAGGRDSDPWIHIPAGFYRNIYNPKIAWHYQTEPVAAFGGRRVSWPRGKVLGGSSSINGLVYIRGQRQDFDQWRQMGNPGWSYDDLLPFFMRAEDHEGGADDWHGAGGPLAVSALRTRHELNDAFIAAAMELGYRFNPDFNGADQEGVGPMPLTVRHRRRCSAAVAYLRPAMRRPNLRVELRALAHRVLCEGRRAVGVEYAQAGVTRRVGAREAVLCGGAINSPQLLQLSGIGAGALLQAHGVPVVNELPGVGETLQDHLSARVIYRCTNRNTLNDVYHSWWRQIHAGAHYVFLKRGPLMTGAAPIGLFFRTRAELDSPDVQFQFVAGSAPKSGEPMHRFPGCTVICVPCRPESRGWVRIVSPEPARAPAIQPNYFATQADRDTMVAGLRVARRLFQTAAMRRYVQEAFLPGPGTETDAQWQDHVRATGGTTFHPVGTCMMGAGPMAVVDAELRVKGMTGLRVIDASIMPTLVSGNTNAACIMIGEKGADAILRGRAGRSGAGRLIAWRAVTASTARRRGIPARRRGSDRARRPA